jgi:hypothetical protein
MRLILIFMTFMTSIGFSSSLFAANCGALNQVPCTLFQRDIIKYGSCDKGLKEDFIKHKCVSTAAQPVPSSPTYARPGHCGRQNQPACASSAYYTHCEAPNILQANGYCNPKPTRPAHCGQQNQRPCAPTEFLPSCESGLLEAKGQCLTPQDATPRRVSRPDYCGHLNQRPCNIQEYLRPCEKDLFEADGQCRQTGYQPPQPAALIPPQEAQQCASENQNCAFNGTADVYFGAQNNWTVQTHTNGVSCSHGVFGDPIPGVLKSCLVVVTQPGFAAPLPVETYPAPANPAVFIPPTYAQPDTATQAPAAVISAPQRLPKFIHPRIPKVRLHSDCEFKGKPILLGPGVYDLPQLQAMGYQDNTLSSLGVPYGYKVLLFDHEKTGFEHIDVRRSIRCLTSMNYNDKVSSITIVPLLHVTLYPECFRYTGRSPLAPASQENEDRIKNSLLLQPGKYLLYQLEDMGFRNDSLSAIRIPPDLEVELFEDDGFQGRSLVLTKTNLCLEKDGFDKKVSSLIVAKAGTFSQKQIDHPASAPAPVIQNAPPPIVAASFGCDKPWRWAAGTVSVESDTPSCTPGASTSYWIIRGVASNALRATGIADEQSGLLTLTVEDAGQRLSLRINHIRSTAPNSAEFRYGLAPDSPLIGAGNWQSIQR